MNVCLQAHGEKLVYPVPSGLHELMSDIAREVLRDQPSDINRFIANYLKSMHKLRETSKRASAFVEELIGRSTEIVSYINSLDVTWEVANNAALKIQNCFKGYKERKLLKEKMKEMGIEKGEQAIKSILEYLEANNLNYIEAEKACRIIQRAYRKHREANKDSELTELPEPVTTEDLRNQTAFIKNINVPKHKHDPNKLVYEQSPEGSMVSTWSNMLPPERQLMCQLVLDKPINCPIHKQSIKSKVFRKTDKLDMPYFTPSGHILSRSSDTVVLIANENEQLEETTNTLMYPRVPEEFYDIDFTQDDGINEEDADYLEVEIPLTAGEKESVVSIFDKFKETLTLSKTSEVPGRESRTSEISKRASETSGVLREESKTTEGLETVSKKIEFPRKESKTSKSSKRGSKTSEEVFRRASKSSVHEETRSVTNISASDVLRRVSKSSLSEVPRKASNISASDVLKRVSKSSITRSTKSPSEGSKEKTHLINDTTNEDIDKSSGDQISTGSKNKSLHLEEIPEEVVTEN